MRAATATAPTVTVLSPPPPDVAAWLAWQERLNPRLVDLGLDRVRPVAARMRLDLASAPLITVAGTNGKGSTVACLEALALAHGLKPACYVSPWLLRYNESVRVGGVAVGDAALVAAFQRVEAARQGVALTAFEYRTLAAASIIAEAAPDLAILEVGLGGRLDAVNLFDADVAVITSIGLDHRDWLGDTLDAVAREKAGILRRGRPVVCADGDAGALLAPLAAAAGARLVLAGRDYRFGASQRGWWLQLPERRFDALPPPALDGGHQRANAAGAVAAFGLARGTVPDAAGVAAALRAVHERGRLERLPGSPERRVDVAHNPQAAGALARWLAERPARGRVLAVCGMFADKDMAGTLALLAPWVHGWHLAPLSPPRGAGVDALACALTQAAPAARALRFADVESAWSAACAAAEGDDLVLAFGSFETARRVLRLESPPATLDT